MSAAKCMSNTAVLHILTFNSMFKSNTWPYDYTTTPGCYNKRIYIRI